MEACGFKEENDVLGPPKGMTEEQVFSLSVFRDGQHVVSCWKMTAEEMEEFKRTGRIYLCVWGVTMPPVTLSPISPFVYPKDFKEQE